ncbi:glycosyl hydrolase [Lineolata rhizophorae]|uniref:Glycosyl hydrolase n=1 Tax=Lineolata rhizophorae TaxID=578093 RepID=A0A6A6NT76_9PEZI|nr:glycosyl hydrolase [Lineolata rhizophorae]
MQSNCSSYEHELCTFSNDGIHARSESDPAPAPRRTRHKFKSYRLKGDYEQPWRSDKRMNRTKYNNYIIWGFFVIALCLSGYTWYLANDQASHYEYCLVMNDDFSTLNEDFWSHEINGFGTGSFDWTTTDSSNSFVDSNGLHIIPTLTNETTDITTDQIFDGYSLNLTRAGGDSSCTGSNNMACAIRSNATTGATLPPVRSARLSTKGKKTVKYGRVEVTAKLPAGDWLWPAIWMMPEDSVYGAWPASGEIDIMESRGNEVEYSEGGRDVVISTLHWGPTPKTDAYWRSSRGKALRRTDYTKGFHTFGIEWSSDYIFTYIDSRLRQVLYYDFKGKKNMWQRGYFAEQTENSSLLEDPWSHTGNANTPFDQEFFLILNVAVGSRNGWFQDGKGEKPWLDDSTSAAADFLRAAGKWLPTWGDGDDRGMTVKSVKMWQQGACP